MSSIKCPEYNESNLEKIIDDISENETLFRAVLQPNFEAYIKENNKVHRSFFRIKGGLSVDKLCDRTENDILNINNNKFKT